MPDDIYEDAVVPAGVKLYRFEDHDTHRELIFEDAMNTLAGRFPMVRNGVRMELDNLRYVDPDKYRLKDQKKALLEDKYLIRRLKGRVRLLDDKTGEVLDEKDMTLMRVPYLTERGTFIRDGNEWGSISQQRLLPGAYSRYQNNGDLETQFNVRPGTGNAFRINFNPESAIYKFTISGSQLHLYSLLHDMGVSDEELRERWGDEIFEKNAAGYDPKVVDRAYKKIVPEWDRGKNPGRTREEMAQMIKKALDRSQIATDVVKSTLPNMFDRRKAASWRSAERCIAKCASMRRGDLEDIAVFVNSVQGTNIDPHADRETIIRDIRNVIRTGNQQGAYAHQIETDAVKAVQQYNAKKVYDSILTKIRNK